jgi:hypothetical protein
MNNPNIEVSAVYQDRDNRRPERFLRVLSVDEQNAHCRDLRNGRSVRIRLTRLSSGQEYTPVTDPEVLARLNGPGGEVTPPVPQPEAA